MNLAQLQRAFQQHVMHGDAALVAEIHTSAAVSATTRLAVYADAYRLRLVDALAHNYPRLQQLLGTESFAVVARDYLDAHPSTNASVRWFGDRLATYLCVTHPDPPVLHELAQWEWAIAAAFDAPDAAILTAETLSTIDPQQWGSLRLHLHPSVQSLRLTTNAPTIFKALASDGTPDAPALLTPQHWLIWRQGLSPRYRSMADDEAAALQTLATGGTFEELCESLCDWHEMAAVPQRAVALLQGWIRDEMIARATSA